MRNHSGMSARLHLFGHLLKWLDPVLHQHLTDMDNNDEQSISSEKTDRVRVHQRDEEWTELEPLRSPAVTGEAGVDAVVQSSEHGALTFFWLFRSLLLLFKRDVQLQAPADNSAPTYDGQLFATI